MDNDTRAPRTAAAHAEPPPTTEALLRQAAALIEQAMARLNVEEHVCGCCRKTTFVNNVEHKVFEIISPMPEKLRTSAFRVSSSTN